MNLSNDITNKINEKISEGWFSQNGISITNHTWTEITDEPILIDLQDLIHKPFKIIRNDY